MSVAQPSLKLWRAAFALTVNVYRFYKIYSFEKLAVPAEALADMAQPSLKLWRATYAFAIKLHE